METDRVTRLDILVAQRYGFSREYAREAIKAGKVGVDGFLCHRPGEKFPETVEIAVSVEKMPYVSRGGFKLEKALRVFPIKLEGRNCLDVGASTGGFTDCMLQKGASFVIAVDTGKSQLSPLLAENRQVLSFEGCDIRKWADHPALSEALGRLKPDFVSVDMSFISLEKALEPVFAAVRLEFEAVLLFKPQFQAGRENITKKGIVKNPRVHVKILREFHNELGNLGYRLSGADFSPIKGQDGNVEYLLYVQNPCRLDFVFDPEKLVSRGVKELG